MTLDLGSRHERFASLSSYYSIYRRTMARHFERVCATSEAAALARKHRNCSRLRRFRWVLACALLLVAAAGAPDPSSLPVNADRRFELSPGTESVLGDRGLIAFDAETLVSTEASGQGGDSRPDSDASLTFPHSVAAAATGSVHVAENGNRGILKSTPVSLVSPTSSPNNCCHISSRTS